MQSGHAGRHVLSQAAPARSFVLAALQRLFYWERKRVCLPRRGTMLSAEMYQGSNSENRILLLFFFFFLLFPRDSGREYNPKKGNSLQGHIFYSGLFHSLCWATDHPFLLPLSAPGKEAPNSWVKAFSSSSVLLRCPVHQAAVTRIAVCFTDVEVFSHTLDITPEQYTVIQLHSGTGHKTPLLFPWARIRRASHPQNKLWI